MVNYELICWATAGAATGLYGMIGLKRYSSPGMIIVVEIIKIIYPSAYFD
jgi:hypothetical protein